MELRNFFGLLAVIGALVFTAYQVSAVWRDYRNWQDSIKVGDRSGADLYALNFKIDCAEILVPWAFAGALIYVLRPKLPTKP